MRLISSEGSQRFLMNHSLAPRPDLNKPFVDPFPRNRSGGAEDSNI